MVPAFTEHWHSKCQYLNLTNYENNNTNLLGSLRNQQIGLDPAQSGADWATVSSRTGSSLWRVKKWKIW